MSKLQQLIDELCPDGVEYKTLGEIGKFTRGNGLQKKDFVDTGKPVIHYGQIYTKYNFSTNITHSFAEEEVFKKLRKAKKNDILIATTSENVKDVAKCVVWLGEEEIGFSGDMYSFSTQENSKYIAYYFQTNYFQRQKELKVTGAKVMRIHSNDMEKFEIPLPPLPVQEEIVRILDTFTEFTTELTTELTMRKQQYEYYRNNLLKSFNTENIQKMQIGDIYEFKYGTGNTIPTVGGLYPVYGSNGIVGTHYEYNSENSPVIGHIGAYAGIVNWGEGKHFVTYNGVICKHKNPSVDYKFAYYLLLIQDFGSKSKNSSQPFVSYGVLKEPEVLVPPLEEQQRIVDILDRFDTLINDIKTGLPAEIEARKQQYEYYRDKLLTFKKLEK